MTTNHPLTNRGTSELSRWRQTVSGEIRYADTVAESQEFEIASDLDKGFSITVMLEPQGPFDGFRTLYHHAFFRLPNVAQEVEMFLQSAQLNSDHSQNVFTYTPRFGKIEESLSNQIVEARASLINFAVLMPAYGVELSHNNWQLTIKPLGTWDKCNENKKTATHTILIRKLNDVAFNSQQLGELLDAFSLFCTFCVDENVAPAYVEGFAASGELAFREWGTRRIGNFRGNRGWLDQHQFASISEAFTCFLSKATHADWQETIRHALYWYIRADTNSTGPDGGIILLQAALERLAWNSLVMSEQIAPMSKSAFKRLNADEQIRRLMCKYRLPLTDVGTLTQLAATMQVETWEDSPEAFTRIRNELTHPERRTTSGPLPYYEAYVVGKWFVETIILAVCNYRGKYSDRRTRQWVGEVQPVPWTITSP